MFGRILLLLMMTVLRGGLLSADDEPVRFLLHDGSVFTGTVTGETTTVITVETAYGTLEIPRSDMAEPDLQPVATVFHESWRLLNTEGDATVRMHLTVKGLSRGEGPFHKTIPVISDMDDVDITSIETPDGTPVEFEQRNAGTVTLATIRGEDPPPTDDLIVSFALTNAVHRLDNGLLRFRRSHSSGLDGRALLEVEYPQPWSLEGELPETARAEGSRVTWDMRIRKHVPVEFGVRFDAGTTGQRKRTEQ